MYYKSLAIFWQFFMRDVRVFWCHSKQRMLNNGFISPVLLAICFGYILPRVAVGVGAQEQATPIFVGNILWCMFPLAFFFMIDVIFDLEQDCFIAYQMTLLSPRLVLLERVVFAAIANFICLLPFFPIAKIVMGSYFNISATNWLQVSLLLLAGSLFITSFNLCTQLLVKDSLSIDNLWLRCYYPLLVLGGGMFSWPVINQFSWLLGAIALFNPLIYLADGLREAILGTGEYFSCGLSLTVLLILFVVCMYFACKIFKRRIDHI